MIVDIFRPSLEELVNFPCREDRLVDHTETMKGLVFMATIDDNPLSAYYITQHKTCLEVHCMASSLVKKYPMAFQKITKSMIESAFDIFPSYDKIVMDIEKRDHKWAISLGFKSDDNVEELETIEGLKTYSRLRGVN